MLESPFKFLDSYSINDRKIFFGRDKEITDLYRKIFEGKILLVYGFSGTGKSSLVNCGLASKFDESDWLPINVRRGSNIIESVNEAVKKHSITNLNNTKSFAEKVQSVYLDHFKPIFLIFDQFEEVFIFGTAEERQEFLGMIKEVVRSKIQCTVIFVMREEFLARMSEFDYSLPEIFSNRYRVEKMKRAEALLAIEGPCKVNGIEIDPEFPDELLDRLCSSGSEIELTYLQIFLDKIFRIAITQNPETKQLKISRDQLSAAGSVSDLLSQFLEEKIKEMDDPDIATAILKSFVSAHGTKKQIDEFQILESMRALGLTIAKADLLIYLAKFIDLRILRERNEAGVFELRHDSLASKIFEKFTSIEKDIIEVRQFIENAYVLFEKRNKLLNADDINYLTPYENKLYLGKQLENFIAISKKEITKSRLKKRAILSIATGLLIIVLTGLTIWAIIERRNAYLEREIANLNYLRSEANNYNFLSQKEIDTNPTVALKLAEYALTLDSSNQDIIENIRTIRSENNFYKIVTSEESVVSAIALAPDGKKIVVCTEDKEFKLYNLQGIILQTFKGHGDVIYAVAFSPDGNTILTGSRDRTACLWDLQGNLLKVFRGHTSAVSTVAFSSSGNEILTGSWDNTARLWDLNGGEISVFRGHESQISSAVFSSDDEYILTGSWDKTARMWNRNGTTIKIFNGHDHYITSVAFSQDNKNILTGSRDKTARLWDLKGNILQVFKGHQDFINTVKFSPNGRSILTGSWDRSVQLWDLYGIVLQTFKGHEGRINTVGFSHDGKFIVTGSSDKTVRVWELQKNILQIYNGHKDGIRSLAFKPDGNNILTGSKDKTAVLWDLMGNKIQEFNGHTGNIESVAFSPDGKKVLTGSDDQTFRIWNLNGTLIHTYNTYGNFINSATFSPDGKNILIGSMDRIALLWGLDGSLKETFRGHGGSISSVAFSFDGKYILTGSWDKTARLWDLNGNVIKVFSGHDDYISSVAFAPDGKRILTGSWDRTARLWDINGNLIHIYKGHDGRVTSVSFDRDGKQILTGSWDKTARLWDINGEIINIFKGHENYIYSVAFSPDNRFILTGSDDRTARIWTIEEDPARIKNSDYEELSVVQKVKFNIMKITDVLLLNDKNSLLEIAEYYCEEINSAGSARRSEYLRNATLVYNRVIDKFNDQSYISKVDSLYKLASQLK